MESSAVPASDAGAPIAGAHHDKGPKEDATTFSDGLTIAPAEGSSE